MFEACWDEMERIKFVIEGGGMDFGFGSLGEKKCR